MVILLCSNPKRGVVAVVNYEPPSSESCEKWNSSDESLASTPTSGYNSGYPFKFFSFPKTCNSCNKLVIGAGFSCRNCHFRCHKRCAIVIDENKEPRLKSKMCSLSRLPPESADFFARLLDSSKQWKRKDDLFWPEDVQRPLGSKLQAADNERGLDSCSGNARNNGNQSRPGPTILSTISATISEQLHSSEFDKWSAFQQRRGQIGANCFQSTFVKRLHDDSLIQANNQRQSNGRQKAENDAKLSSARSPLSHLQIISNACNCITCGTRVNTAQDEATLATTGRKATYYNSEHCFKQRSKKIFSFEAVLRNRDQKIMRSSLANHTSDLNEWTIPFEDLKFEQCILHSQSIT
ncbi:hypothetical protein T4E_2483, partial [Trichinella pseudospiralis]